MVMGRPLSLNIYANYKKKRVSLFDKNNQLPQWHDNWAEELKNRIALQRKAAIKPVFNLTGRYYTPI